MTMGPIMGPTMGPTMGPWTSAESSVELMMHRNRKRRDGDAPEPETE